MAETKTEIEKRLDRIELALKIITQWLAEAQTSFGVRNDNTKIVEDIDKILQGE
jgi:hypothetical protein